MVAREEAEQRVHEAWVDLVRVRPDYPLEVVPACGEPSPSGAMLCDLPRTKVGHFMGQHLGVDRNGNFRGWPDKRTAL